MHEAVVGGRFDALCGRFKREVAADDPRLRGDRRAALGRWRAGGSSTWGAARGGLRGAWPSEGAEVVGLDLSAGMLAEADGLSRVRALGAAAAVWPGELRRGDGGRGLRAPGAGVDRSRLRRGAARARAGGNVRGHRQERVLVECPAAVAAERGGEVDRRAPGAVDVPARRSGARALVPAAGAEAAAAPVVSRGAGPASALAERSGPVSVSVGAGRAAVRALGGAGAGRDRCDRALFAQAGVASAAACGRRRRGWS